MKNCYQKLIKELRNNLRFSLFFIGLFGVSVLILIIFLSNYISGLEWLVLIPIIFLLYFYLLPLYRLDKITNEFIKEFNIKELSENEYKRRKQK